ncbi:MAG: HD domain-containing protein [Aureispira sp.]|nr:HD domain-containing protein [Aureispira sp.]
MRHLHKIINDPIYEIIEIPYGLIFELVEHPYYQRLRRITQLGLTHYVYPGATHTRFNHTLGAMHLIQKAIRVLRIKGVEITEEEAEGLMIAILLHDIGHGPFSHSLEYVLLNIPHEDLSIAFMEELNKEFDGRLTLALKIFRNQYHKKYLYQLVSGQLDMDRLDYLTRDSFFTGVYEGKVGYNRIIKTLNVYKEELVVEYKGIYSIEKFLIARRLMYWQVYLHKTVICAGEMLVKALERAKVLMQNGYDLDVSKSLAYFLSQDISSTDLLDRKEEVLGHFQQIDDYDIVLALKGFSQHEDFVLSYLAQNLLNRKLMRVRLQDGPIGSDFVEQIRTEVKVKYNLSDKELEYLVIEGTETNTAYDFGGTEIKILMADGSIQPISKWQEHHIPHREVIKSFICYPKFT